MRALRPARLEEQGGRRGQGWQRVDAGKPVSSSDNKVTGSIDWVAPPGLTGTASGTARCSGVDQSPTHAMSPNVTTVPVAEEAGGVPKEIKREIALCHTYRRATATCLRN